MHSETGRQAVDPIPLWKTWWRKFMTFRAVAQKKRKGPISQQEFVEKISQIQRQAAQSSDMRVKTVALWKLESLGFSLVRYAQPGNTLHDPKVPIETRPIVHVGMGAGAVEKGKFKAAKITEIIESVSHPNYRLFPYESLGAMLALYEAKIPLERMLLGLDPLQRPEPDEFLKAFSCEITRLISHGYGRLLYFRSNGIGAAIQAATRRPFLQLSASVQGMAFAYAMANHGDLYRALEAGRGLQNPDLAQAFKNGLIYALEFWEWVSPGFLNSLRPATSQQAVMITAALKEIEENRSRGFLKAFAVGQ